MTDAPTNSEDRDRQAGSVTEWDRRRPGRPAVVSPELLPLLRGEIEPELRTEVALDQAVFGNPDQLRAATGLAVSLALSGAMWFGIARIARLII